MKKPSAVFAYLVFEMLWIIHRIIIAGMILINTGFAHDIQKGYLNTRGYADVVEQDSDICRTNNKYCSYITAFYLTGAAYIIESGKKLD